MKTSICKKFRFSYGHHLPEHPRCGEAHGHNAILEVEVSGPVNKEGMVIDFTDLSLVVKKKVVDILDHKYLNHVLWDTPTAENIAKNIWDLLVTSFEDPISLQRITFYETDDSYATVNKD